MIAMSTFVILLVAVVVGIWLKRTDNGSLALGILFGLSLAATTFGPPILGGFQWAMDSLVQLVSSLAGA